MLLLAIDTSQKNGSVTLWRDENALRTVIVEGGTFSAQLVPAIAVLLKKHGVLPSEIEGFATCVGPGSFTGLRIGLAALKALAEVMRKPIATVSSLEAVASLSAAPKVIAVLDAGRSEIYRGEYSREGARLRCIRESLSTAQRLDPGKTIVTTPDERLGATMRDMGATVEIVRHFTSADVARLAVEKLQRGETISADALEASYVRQDETMFQKQI